jgi:hypothetical protein
MFKTFDFIDLSNIDINKINYNEKNINEKNINVKIILKENKKLKKPKKSKRYNHLKYYFNNSLLKKIKKN